MGLDIAAFQGLKPEPEVSQEDASDQGMLAFYEGEIGEDGFSGMDLSIAYSYEDSYEEGMGNFAGVGKFHNTLTDLSGFPGDPQSADYKGPFRALFQARDWIGPIECVAIAAEFRRLDGCWLSPVNRQILSKHGWEQDAFADYFLLWKKLFEFTGDSGAVNLF